MTGRTREGRSIVDGCFVATRSEIHQLTRSLIHIIRIVDHSVKYNWIEDVDILVMALGLFEIIWQ